MKVYRLSIFILSLFVVFSCERKNCIVENDFIENSDYQKIVQFTSEIQTKALNSTWENGDRIGIFMKSTGATLADPAIVNGASNKIYKTSVPGIFAADSETETIYFPTDNSGVDFIAYYPYRSDISNYIY